MPNKDVPKVFKTETEALQSEQNSKTVFRVGAAVAVFILAVAAVVWLI